VPDSGLPLFDSQKLTKSSYRVPISEVSSYSWIKNYDTFLKQSPNFAEMLIKDLSTGKLHAPRPGEIYKNPCLAQTFREVAEKGKAGFYEGRIAEAIVERKR
jgi:gamma-glutamyltranspeptidase/glutathione hydrolase